MLIPPPPCRPCVRACVHQVPEGPSATVRGCERRRGHKTSWGRPQPGRTARQASARPSKGQQELENEGQGRCGGDPARCRRRVQPDMNTNPNPNPDMYPMDRDSSHVALILGVARLARRGAVFILGMLHPHLTYTSAFKGPELCSRDFISSCCCCCFKLLQVGQSVYATLRVLPLLSVSCIIAFHFASLITTHA